MLNRAFGRSPCFAFSKIGDVFQKCNFWKTRKSIYNNSEYRYCKSTGVLCQLLNFEFVWKRLKIRFVFWDAFNLSFGLCQKLPANANVVGLLYTDIRVANVYKKLLNEAQKWAENSGGIFRQTAAHKPKKANRVCKAESRQRLSSACWFSFSVRLHKLFTFNFFSVKLGQYPFCWLCG